MIKAFESQKGRRASSEQIYAEIAFVFQDITAGISFHDLRLMERCKGPSSCVRIVSFYKHSIIIEGPVLLFLWANKMQWCD